MPSLETVRRRSEGNWFWLNNQILELTPRIGPAGLAVYVVLAFHGNNKKNAATIYHRTIADQSGWKLSKVKMALDLLIEVGAIELCPASKRGQANTYYLLKLPPVIPLSANPEPDGEVSHVVADLQEVAGSHVVAEVSHVVADPSHVVAPLLINKTSFKTEVKTNTPPPPAEAVAGSPEFPVPGNGSGPPLTAEQKHIRFRAAVIDLIDVAYKKANGIAPEETGKVPWGSRAVKRLELELRNYKAWTLDDWQRCISNRFTSDGIIHGEPPDSFIPYLKRYTSGPLDQYHKLKGATNGNIGVNQRAARNRAAGEQVDREIDESFARRRAAAAEANPGVSDRDS